MWGGATATGLRRRLAGRRRCAYPTQPQPPTPTPTHNPHISDHLARPHKTHAHTHLAYMHAHTHTCNKHLRNTPTHHPNPTPPPSCCRSPFTSRPHPRSPAAAPGAPHAHNAPPPPKPFPSSNTPPPQRPTTSFRVCGLAAPGDTPWEYPHHPAEPELAPTATASSPLPAATASAGLTCPLPGHSYMVQLGEERGQEPRGTEAGLCGTEGGPRGTEGGPRGTEWGTRGGTEGGPRGAEWQGEEVERAGRSASLAAASDDMFFQMDDVAGALLGVCGGGGGGGCSRCIGVGEAGGGLR